MPTYIYETISESCCAEPKHYEIDQCENDLPLTRHPKTGETIKRVVLGGVELVKKEEVGESCCGSGDCC